jgi:hypothetical protein
VTGKGKKIRQEEPTVRNIGSSENMVQKATFKSVSLGILLSLISAPMAFPCRRVSKQ